MPERTGIFSSGAEAADTIRLIVCKTDDIADMAIALKLMSRPENLPGIKANLVCRLVTQLEPVVQNRIRDRSCGFWGDYYAADPSQIFSLSDLIYCLMPMIQKDVYPFILLICDDIISAFHIAHHLLVPANQLFHPYQAPQWPDAGTSCLRQRHANA